MEQDQDFKQWNNSIFRIIPPWICVDCSGFYRTFITIMCIVQVRCIQEQGTLLEGTNGYENLIKSISAMWVVCKEVPEKASRKEGEGGVD